MEGTEACFGGQGPEHPAGLDVVLLEGGCGHVPGQGRMKSSRGLLCVPEDMSTRQLGMCVGRPSPGTWHGKPWTG